MIEPRKGTGGRIIPAFTGFGPLLAAVVALTGCSTEPTCPGGSYMEGGRCVLVAQDAAFSNFYDGSEPLDAAPDSDDSEAIEADDTNELDNSESEKETNATSDTNQRDNDADPDDTAADDDSSAETGDNQANPSDDEGSQSG